MHNLSKTKRKDGATKNHRLACRSSYSSSSFHTCWIRCIRVMERLHSLSQGVGCWRTSAGCYVHLLGHRAVHIKVVSLSEHQASLRLSESLLYLLVRGPAKIFCSDSKMNFVDACKKLQLSYRMFQNFSLNLRMKDVPEC